MLKGWPSWLWIAVWVVLAIFIGLLTASVNVPRLVQLTAAGVSTQGTVVDRQPTNHNATIVNYEVNGTVYREGSTFVSAPNPQPPNVGDSEKVVYLPSDPTLMSIGDPNLQLSNDVGSVLAAAVLLPTFGVGLTYLRVRFWKERPARRNR